MKYLLLFTFVLPLNFSYAQGTNTSPVDVTEAMQARLKQEVEKEVPAFTQQLQKLKLETALIDFEVDTFRIEHFVKKWIDLDYRDFGMAKATYEGAKQYDALLNKYYKKVMAALKPEDKPKLVQAQKAWLIFRDSEIKLAQVVNNQAYSGGTIQSVIDASDYSELIKTRTISLFQYYSSMADRK